MKSQVTSRTVRTASFSLESEEEVRALELVLLAARDALQNDSLVAYLRDRGELPDAERAVRQLIDTLHQALTPERREILTPPPTRSRKPKEPPRPALFRRRRRSS